MEQSRRPVIAALSLHAELELFPLNPAMAAKYRQATKAASGTKNDPLDASLQCELLRLHRDWLRPLTPLPADTRELGLLVEARRALIDQRTALCQQLSATLKGYAPFPGGERAPTTPVAIPASFVVSRPHSGLEKSQTTDPPLPRSSAQAARLGLPDATALLRRFLVFFVS